MKAADRYTSGSVTDAPKRLETAMTEDTILVIAWMVFSVFIGMVAAFFSHETREPLDRWLIIGTSPVWVALALIALIIVGFAFVIFSWVWIPWLIVEKLRKRYPINE